MEVSVTIDSSKKEFGYYYDLYRLKNEEEFKRSIRNTIEEMGFSDFSLLYLNGSQNGVNGLDTFPPDMRQKYNNNNYMIDDPAIEHAKNTNHAFYSSQIQDELAKLTIYSRAAHQCRLIYELHKSYGYYNFLYVPIANKYLLTVSSRGDIPVHFMRRSEGLALTLALLGEAIYEVGLKKFPQCFPVIEDIDLKEKPLNVLHELANNDLTIGQLADKLSISRITANHHLQTARNRLGVSTNYAAIKKAMQEKLIRYQ